MNDIAVQFRHVSMAFPGVLANDDVSLDIRKGEVFALVGENGAGKSTLMNILYGIHTPTGGSVSIRGEEVSRFSPRNAIDHGVGMVHQHFMLVPSFTVAQNIVMSREPRRFGIFFDQRAAERETRRLVEEYGLTVDPNAVVAETGVGLQQRVEILKTLYRGAEILILDEPTTYVDSNFEKEFYTILEELNKSLSIVMVSHDLGTICSYVKTIACVNRELHYHNSNLISAEQLQSYHCPIELITHGKIPHRVLKEHEKGKQ